MGLVLLGGGDAFGPVASHNHPVLIPTQNAADIAPQVGVVVHHQHQWSIAQVLRFRIRQWIVGAGGGIMLQQFGGQVCQLDRGAAAFDRHRLLDRSIGRQVGGTPV